MATFSKLALQQTTMTTGTGLGVLVAATATAGTTIHTAANVATTVDEIYLYAVNTSTASVKLTIEWGEATAPNGNIEVTVQPESGLVLVVPGLVLQGNATPKVVKAFAATASVIVLHGFVNRITA
jgi:hypothetical protein